MLHILDINCTLLDEFENLKTQLYVYEIALKVSPKLVELKSPTLLLKIQVLKKRKIEAL